MKEFKVEEYTARISEAVEIDVYNHGAVVAVTPPIKPSDVALRALSNNFGAKFEVFHQVAPTDKKLHGTTILKVSTGNDENVNDRFEEATRQLLMQQRLAEPDLGANEYDAIAASMLQVQNNNQ